jgi:hypothetical protein
MVRLARRPLLYRSSITKPNGQDAWTRTHAACFTYLRPSSADFITIIAESGFGIDSPSSNPAQILRQPVVLVCGFGHVAA